MNFLHKILPRYPRYTFSAFLSAFLFFSRSFSMESSSGTSQGMLQTFVDLRKQVVSVCQICTGKIEENVAVMDDIVDYNYKTTMFFFKNTTKIRNCNLIYMIDLCIGLRVISLLNQVINSRSFELNAFSNYLESSKKSKDVKGDFKKWNAAQEKGYEALKELLELRENFPKILKNAGVYTKINLQNSSVDNLFASHIKFIKEEQKQMDTGIQEIKNDNMSMVYKDWNVVNGQFLFDVFNVMTGKQREFAKRVATHLNGDGSSISPELVENAKYKMKLPKNLDKDVGNITGYEAIICHCIQSYRALHSGYVSKKSIVDAKGNNSKQIKMTSEYQKEEVDFRKSVNDLYECMGDVDPNLQKQYMSGGSGSVIGSENRQTLILD